MKSKTNLTKKIPKAILSAVTESTIEALRDLEQIAVCRYAGDTSGALRSGAVLLGISRVDNDDDGDGFRFLIGLKRGTPWIPYFGNFFQER